VFERDFRFRAFRLAARGCRLGRGARGARSGHLLRAFRLARRWLLERAQARVGLGIDRGLRTWEFVRAGSLPLLTGVTYYALRFYRFPFAFPTLFGIAAALFFLVLFTRQVRQGSIVPVHLFGQMHSDTSR